MDDFSKFFLFVAIAIAILVMLGYKPRPLASAPLEPQTDIDQVPTEQSDVTRGPGWAGVPNAVPPPLSLMMPLSGVQPLGNA